MRPAELIGQTLDQKYLIDSQLGQGGMGAVYVATHLGTKRPVAVKIIIPQFMAHTEFVERFRREAEAAGRLCHPNVVNVTDFGFATVGQNRIAYLVMEYLQGCTLGEILKEESKLRLEFVIDIVEQICGAIEAAHQQGIIHRDLKPDNIWLEPNGCGGYNVKVLDFGLAKLSDDISPNAITNTPELLVNSTNNVLDNISRITAVQLPKTPEDLEESATQVQPPKAIASIPSLTEADETSTQIQPLSDEEEKTQIQNPCATTNTNSTKKTEQLTRVGAILGTPVYMSPEQCKGEELDQRSDIYSLGIMVYEMLAGQTPFNGNMNALLTQHLTTTPPSLREKRKDIPKAVADLVMSALAKDPLARPASAVAFASALHARSETAFTLLKQALTFYTEHFPTIIRLSLLSYSLIIIPTILLGISGMTSKGGRHFTLSNNTISSSFSSRLQIAVIAINFLLLILGHLLASIANLVVFTPILAKLRLFPTRSAKIDITKTLKKYLRPVLVTAPHLYGRIILGTVCCFIPAIILNIMYLLVYPVIVIEGLEAKAALTRSKELISRVKWTASLTWILTMIIPTAANAILAPYIKNLTALKFNSIWLTTAISISANLIDLLPSIIVNPIIFLMMSLLYFQACQYQGESLSEKFRQQLEEENVLTNWQKQMQQQVRMRSRISTAQSTKSSL